MFDTPKRRPGRGGGGSGGQPVRVNDVLRFLLEWFAFLTLALWGYEAWAFPLPGLFFAIGLPLFAIVMWRLFRSRQAVVTNDPVGTAIVEIAIMGAATYCWFSLGYPFVGIVFGVLALVSGVVHFRRENAA